MVLLYYSVSKLVLFEELIIAFYDRYTIIIVYLVFVDTKNVHAP